jgi:hypothetical protein
MRPLYLLFILSLTSASICLSQDVIYKKDGSEIKSKVIEIQEDVVKYLNYDQLDGPYRNLPKKDIFLIIYADGTREKFEVVNSTPQESQKENIQSDVKTSSSSNKVQLDYVNLKLEKNRSMENFSKGLTYLGAVCISIGFIRTITDNEDGPQEMLVGTGIVVIGAPLWLIFGSRVNYFERRRAELSLNLEPQYYFQDQKLMTSNALALNIKIRF